jgi:hypothetical protein
MAGKWTWMEMEAVKRALQGVPTPIPKLFSPFSLANPELTGAKVTYWHTELQNLDTQSSLNFRTFLLCSQGDNL